MSAYQYYEFQAIDRPLTADQQARVAALSSRAHVTTHLASFVYNYGDFRGDPEQLLRDYFDAMLYVANWGSRRLMVRIPSALIDAKRVKLYCVSEAIDLRQTPNKQHMIVEASLICPSSCVDAGRIWPRGANLMRQRLRQGVGPLRPYGKLQLSGSNSGKPQNSARLSWPASVT